MLSPGEQVGPNELVGLKSSQGLVGWASPGRAGCLALSPGYLASSPVFCRGMDVGGRPQGSHKGMPSHNE